MKLGEPIKIMKIIFLSFLLSTFICVGCETTNIKNDANNNPCKDSIYLSLKNKKLDSLSPREFEYFLAIDKQCRDFSKIDNVNDKTTVIVIGGLVSIILGIVIWGSQSHWFK